MPKNEPLMSIKEVYEVLKNPIYHKPTLVFFGCSTINDYVDRMFRKIPQEAIDRYALAHMPISGEEQRDFSRFYAALALEGHRNQERYNGRNYAFHPLSAADFEAGFDVSCFALNCTKKHDLWEEWASQLGLNPEDPEYGSKSTALLIGPSILAYGYVRNKFNDPRRFFPHINSILRVFDKVTRRPGKSYFRNLYGAFYTKKRKDYLVSMLRRRENRNYARYLGEFFGIKDLNLIAEFIRDIIRYGPSEQEKEKNRRRAIMTEIADMYANCTDLEGLPPAKTAKILTKGAFVTNETHGHYTGKKTPESKSTLNRIVEENQALADLLVQGANGISPVIPDIIKQLSRDSRITKKIIQDYNFYLGANLEKFLHSRKNPAEEDRDELHEMRDQGVNVLTKYSEVIVQEDDAVAYYKYIRFLEEIFRALADDKELYIRLMSLKRLKKLQPAERNKKPEKRQQGLFDLNMG